MRHTRKTFLFGTSTIATAISGRSSFKHTFGGPHDRQGCSRDDCSGILIHLLHRLDLSDPAIPITIPGIRWLPLYYCFDFRVNVLGYRLLSDDALVTYIPTDDPNVTDREEWPGDDYPLMFPKSSMKVTGHAYDPTNLEDAYGWAGIFGLKKLSKGDQADAKNRVIEDADMMGMSRPVTAKDFQEAWSLPFIQGKPDGNCMNPRCANHKKQGKLAVIALLPAEPVKGIHTFGQFGSGVELIFEMCPRCYTIRVSNQCD